ncbi:MAG: DNA methyltransferase [Chloroflexaceae bacterium]|nr:DNA methyltransferase [Chloroflexaceae bacterium]
MDDTDEREQPPALNLPYLLDMLDQMRSAGSLEEVRHFAALLQEQLAASGSTPSASGLLLLNDLTQIAEARTLERACYYTERLIRSVTEVKTTPINDINLNQWKAYDHIWTDSLWVMDRRDSSGVHAADYWGNFVPQIPHQMMLRYTKRGEWVLDTFAGSGTTLIEGQRLGRHTIGVELQAEVAEQARQRVAAEPNPHGVVWDVVVGDSTTVDFPSLLRPYGQQSVQLVVMHPPYFDIIKFSADGRDLANARSLDDFLAKMGMVVERVATVLDRGRYLVLVIGDKYVEGEWVPLGFLTMQEVQRRGFALKSIVVKNFDTTTAKRTQKELWRYRALVGGFYLFKHEYVFIFRKRL